MGKLPYWKRWIATPFFPLNFLFHLCSSVAKMKAIILATGKDAPVSGFDLVWI
jgi:hypothetical protein